LTKVINFYGGPSAGKSTNAFKLAGLMKERRMNVEFVPEFAKGLTWKKDFSSLDDQLMVFAQQNHMLYILQGQVDYIVTDSPLLLSMHYMHVGWSKFREGAAVSQLHNTFADMIISTYAQYENINFYVERGDREFVQAGRNQSEDEAIEIDDAVFRLLSRNMIPFKRIHTLDQVVETLGI
jgi:hypothetical protein